MVESDLLLAAVMAGIIGAKEIRWDEVKSPQEEQDVILLLAQDVLGRADEWLPTRAKEA